MIDIYRQLFELLPKGDGWKWLMLTFGMILSALLEMIGIGIIPIIIASMTNSKLDDTSLPSSDQSLWNIQFIIKDQSTEQIIFIGSIIIVAFFFLKNLYIVLYSYLESKYVWNRYTYIATKLLNAYVSAPYTFHRLHHTNILQKNISEESRLLVENLLTAAMNMVRSVLLIFLILFLLVLVEPLITIGTILFIGGSTSIVLYLLKKKLTQYGEDAHNARLTLLLKTGNIFSGIKELRVLRRIQLFNDQATYQIKRFSRVQSSFLTAQKLSKPIIETIAIIGLVGITLSLWQQGRTLVQIVPVLTLFGAATLRLLPEVRTLIGNINSIRYFEGTMKPVRKDINMFAHYTLNNEPQLESSSPVQIKFRNLCYRYPDSDKFVINNLNWELKRGSVTGLIGNSGTGKSTLVDLLLGLLKPDKGSILMNDDLDIDTYKEYQSSVGYIPQMIFLTDDTLRNNIALGVKEENISDERIMECLNMVHLIDFYSELPNGLDTITGEQGIRLSGGQRQRIGIARALYHEPGLIVMDEATSALDKKTESDILDSIEKLKGKCTFLIISHRETGLRICESLWKLENGNVYLITKSGNLNGA